MSEYSVGINVDDIIEAEDELDVMVKFFESLTLDAMAKFFESLTWKQCYASEIESQAEREE